MPQHTKTGRAYDYAIAIDPSVAHGDIAVILAEKYRLAGGAEAAQSCQANAEACSEVGAPQLATVWLLLAQMLLPTPVTTPVTRFQRDFNANSRDFNANSRY